jgi:glutamate 5-kinase
MRFVIKIGTSLLATSNHELDVDFLKRLIGDIAAIKKQGHEVILVSSGAVAAGRSEMSVDREKKNIPFRQALAAIGQGILMKTYHDFFAQHRIVVAQALLTNYDFTNRGNFLNTKNVFSLLLEKNVIPIVNENDVTTIAELKFGDNDMLSAKTAAMVSADFLIILTDVEGLFLEDPKNNPHAKLIPVVEKVDASVKKLAGGARSKSSLGGMMTKLEAAEYVTSVGIHMFIAGGRREGILKVILSLSQDDGMLRLQHDHFHGTFFPSSVNRLVSQKKWLKPKIQKNAWIEIDAGAQKALREMGKSLLPKGVTSVHGIFHRGDVVMVKCGGQDMGYGQVNYSSEDIDKIKKHHSDEIEQILGFSFEEELIHRDRMVI